MAIMCPSVPREYTKASREDYIFEVLSKLPDSYYVFHSVSLLNITEKGIEEREGDFVVFEPTKGILCIEAKAGQVRYENGIWYYGDGRKMDHNGPFNQASNFKHSLIKKILLCGCENLLRRCKFLHAVWFPSIKKSYFDKVILPTEADRRIMIFKDSEENIENVISGIFDIEVNNIKTKLGNNDTRMIIDKVLAPEFNVISIAQMKRDNNEMIFGRLLKEQNALLNYLEEQDRAVINGMAGTGKTLMAVEKAKRHAMNGERVLFLCYNRFLREHLRECYPIDNVDYYTLDALACKLCNTRTPDMELLSEKLEEMYFSGDFEYKHIIIDEGQDFGQARIEESNIITALQMLVLDNDFNQGSFYIFYDKNQLVQGEKVPDYIADADCKLTLYRNCRNTANIATTSLRLLGSDKKPRLKENALFGDTPEMYIETTEETLIAAVNDAIDRNIDNEIEDIVILTCKTEETSFMSSYVNDGIYQYHGRKVKFTTCRKFKGLEADAVIMTDIDESNSGDLRERIIYVGSSRARFRLSIIADLDDTACMRILNQLNVKPGRRPAKSLATAYNSKYIDIEKR